MSKTALALLCATAFGLLTAIALAEEPLELRWDAPKGCPTKEEVLKEVHRILGTGEVRRHVDAEAVVSRSGDRWSLSLRTQQGGGEGERTLEGRSCKAVAAAAALVLALTLQTDAPEPVASSATPPPPPPPPPPMSTTPPPPPRMRVIPVVRAGLGAALTTLPNASAMVHGSAGVRFGRYEAAATFAFVSEASQTAEQSMAGGQFSLFGFGLTGCTMPLALFGQPSLELWVCGGGEVQWMIARSFGAECGGPNLPNCEEAYALFAPVLLPRVTLVPIRNMALTLDGVFAFPLERRRFVLQTPSNDKEPVFRVPALGLRIQAAIELRF